MRFLITGGCGFIGSRLINGLAAENGHFIRVIDNLSVGKRENLTSSCRFCVERAANKPVTWSKPSPGIVELIVGDLQDERLALQAAQEMDVIVYLANTAGTLNYLEAARINKIKRFILVSGIDKDTAYDYPYNISMLAGEADCLAYFHGFGLETVVLRFSDVYGPGYEQKNSVVAKIIRQALEGKRIEILGDDKLSRGFIYIDDLICALRLAIISKGIGGEVFNICANKHTSTNELLDKLLPVLAQAGVHPPEIDYSSRQSNDLPLDFSDTSKAMHILGWQAFTELEDGLAQTVEWFVRNNYKMYPA